MESRSTEALESLERDLGRALEGAIWPLSRDEVVAVARENEASREVLTLLGRLPGERFVSDSDVRAWLE